MDTPNNNEQLEIADNVIHAVKKHFSTQPDSFQMFIRFLELYRGNLMTDMELIRALLKLFAESPGILNKLLPFFPPSISSHIQNNIIIATQASLNIKIATQDLLEKIRISFLNDDDKFLRFVQLLQKLRSSPTTELILEIRALINNKEISKELERSYLAPYREEVLHIQRQTAAAQHGVHFLGPSSYFISEKELYRRLKQYVPPTGSFYITHASVREVFSTSFKNTVPLKTVKSVYPRKRGRRGRHPATKRLHAYNEEHMSGSTSYDEWGDQENGMSNMNTKNGKEMETDDKEFEYSSSDNETIKPVKKEVERKIKEDIPVTMESLGIVDIPVHYHPLLIGILEVYERESEETCRQFSKLLNLYNLGVIDRIELILLLKSLFDYIDNSFADRLFNGVSYCDTKLHNRLYPIKCTMYTFLKEKLYKMDSYDYISPSYMKVSDEFIEKHNVRNNIELPIFTNKQNFMSRSKGRERKQGNQNEGYIFFEEKISVIDVRISRLRSLLRRMSEELVNKNKNDEYEIDVKINKIDEEEIGHIYKEKKAKIVLNIKQGHWKTFGVIINRINKLINKYKTNRKTMVKDFYENEQMEKKNGDKERNKKDLFVNIEENADRIQRRK
eukprot:GAHX01000768.1.p1 GENE.GAHX01000768.1~~GAHX01000768.1.p1  ORF type:complete len:616 (-),score=139.86 GAHX01000768.1:45-1892(-)